MHISEQEWRRIFGCLTRDDIRSMTAEQIVEADQAGHLDQLLGRVTPDLQDGSHA